METDENGFRILGAAQALIDDRVTSHDLKQNLTTKQRQLEQTRINKGRKLVESVNPFTIFETDSNAELGSVMSSMIQQERPDFMKHSSQEKIIEEDFEEDLVPVSGHPDERISSPAF